MLGKLGWRSSLEDRCTDARLCLFYKIVHGLVAVPLPLYVVQLSDLEIGCRTDLELHQSRRARFHTSITGWVGAQRPTLKVLSSRSVNLTTLFTWAGLVL